MKTVIDAVNEFKGEWPYHEADNMIYCKLSYSMYKLGAIESYTCDEWSGLNTINWSALCSKDEFNQCVEEMSKAEWINPVTSPTYTQAMCDAGELPSAGMECCYSSSSMVIWNKCTVIAYYDGFVWTSDNGVRPLANTKFRPLTPPVKLIDGKAYQFKSRINKVLCGVYQEDYDVLNVRQGQYFDVTAVSNIKPLTVEGES